MKSCSATARYRGLDTDAEVALFLANWCYNTIYGGLEVSNWQFPSMRKALRKQKSRRRRMTKVNRLLPDLLTMEVLDARGNDQVPDVVAAHVHGALRLSSYSLDLWRQYADWQGGGLSAQNHKPDLMRPSASVNAEKVHCSSLHTLPIPSYTARPFKHCPSLHTLPIPSYTAHPFMVAVYMASLPIQQCPLPRWRRRELIDQLKILANNYRLISQAYSRANSPSSTLSKDMQALSDAFTDILEVKTCKDARAIRRLLSSEFRVPPRPDIKAMIDLYPLTGPSTPLAFLSPADKSQFNDLRERLQSERRRTESLTDAEIKQYESAFSGVLRSICIASGLQLPTNEDGFPTTFWPGASSRDEYHPPSSGRLRSSATPVRYCGDHRHPMLERLRMWPVGHPCRLVHPLSTDTTTHILGLLIDMSGLPSSSLKPTLCAHITHGKRSFSSELTHMALDDVRLFHECQCLCTVTAPQQRHWLRQDLWVAFDCSTVEEGHDGRRGSQPYHTRRDSTGWSTSSLPGAL
ncbi:unnamed protein product [Sympodiomycopsis kandeliae]